MVRKVIGNLYSKREYRFHLKIHGYISLSLSVCVFNPQHRPCSLSIIRKFLIVLWKSINISEAYHPNADTHTHIKCAPGNPWNSPPVLDINSLAVFRTTLWGPQLCDIVIMAKKKQTSIPPANPPMPFFKRCLSSNLSSFHTNDEDRKALYTAPKALCHHRLFTSQQDSTVSLPNCQS